MQEKNRGDNSEGSSKESEKQTLTGNQAADSKAGKAKSLQDCSFLDTAADDQEDGVGYQSKYCSHCTQSEPVGKPNEFNHLLGGFSKEGFLWAGDRRLGVGTEGGINFFRHWVKELCRIHLDVELGHRSKPYLGGLLKKGEMNVGHVVILSLVGFDDTCNVDVDAYRCKLVTSLERPTLRECLAYKSCVGSTGPILK